MPEIDEKELASLKENAGKAADLQKQLDELNKKLTEKGGKEDDKEDEGDDDNNLRKKTIKDKEEKDKRAAETKSLENAVRFNLNLSEFAKSNSDLLPEEISDILKKAEKETYDSQADKANAVRAAIVESYFAVQANLDLLTESQKSKVASFLKLSPAARQSRSEEIYSDVFEPVLEMNRRIKKVEDLGKSRLDGGNKSQDAYKDRLLKQARKTYLGEKETA